MSLQRNLIFGFLAGLVLTGVGSGIAFGEFSSFEYGGQKKVSGNLETKTMTLKIDSTKGNYYFKTYSHMANNITIETDEAIADDEIKIQTETNSGIMPALSLNQDFYEELEFMDEYSDDVFFNSSDGRYYDTKQMNRNDMVYEIYFDYYRYGSDILDMVKAKDEILEMLKERKLHDYVYYDIEKITIKVSPANKDRVFTY